MILFLFHMFHMCFFGVDCHHHDLLVYEPMLWCHHHKYSWHILAIWWRWCAWNIGIPQMGKGWPKLGPAGRDKMWSWWCELRSFSSQFHCVGCLALLPNKTSLPLDKAASNPTAIGESNCSLLSNCVDYFFFWRKPFILAVFSRVAQGVSSSLWESKAKHLDATSTVGPCDWHPCTKIHGVAASTYTASHERFSTGATQLNMNVIAPPHPNPTPSVT